MLDLETLNENVRKIGKDLEGALWQRILEHVPFEVGALAGHLQQQIGGQAQKTPFYLAGVQGTEHRQHSLQGRGGEALLLTPEVTDVKPGEKG